MNKLLNKLSSALEKRIKEKTPLIKNIPTENIAGLAMLFGTFTESPEIVYAGMAYIQSFRNHSDKYMWITRRK